METFDADGDGTIWQGKEMRPILKELCGDDHGDCYKRGMEAFFAARGDKKDGVQIEEVIAWLKDEREKHIDEIMKIADANNDHMMKEIDAKKTELDKVWMEADEWFKKWDIDH